MNFIFFDLKYKKRLIKYPTNPPYRESPGYPLIKRNFNISNPKSFKLRSTYATLERKIPPASATNTASNISPSLYEVSLIFFHNIKRPQKKESTKKTPNV